MIYYNTSPSFISSNVGQNKKSERYWTIATAFKNIINKPFFKKKNWNHSSLIYPLLLGLQDSQQWTLQKLIHGPFHSYLSSTPLWALPLNPLILTASPCPVQLGFGGGGSGHLEYILLTWKMIATLNIFSTPFHPFP